MRFRWKNLAILGSCILVGLVLFVVLTFTSTRAVRSSALAQAEQARKNGEIDLALRHLDRYLTDHPEDIAVLESKAKILSEAPLPMSQVIEAANSLDLLIRLDPNGVDRVATRRKLAEFYIQYSDNLKRFAEMDSDPDVERRQSRYSAAASIALQLVDDAKARKTPDAVAHRLLARAYEGQISEIRGKLSMSGAAETPDLKQNEQVEDLRLRTIKNYQAAIEIDPQDLEAAIRLANLYYTWIKDERGGDAVLDAMLKANPTSIPARLARYRAFGQSKRADKDELAKAELEAILAIDPRNVNVRIEAANVALGRRDPIEARRQLDAISAKEQEDIRVKILRGYMEFAEQHPDDAIDQWRRGLSLVGGTNQDLTWRLAFNLIQLDRLKEAEPLRQQYSRLSKGDKAGMGRFLDAMFDMGYGRLYDAREKLDKIKDIVQPGVKTDVLLALGRCCEMMGDADAALLTFRNAATASPASFSPRLAIARHLQKRHPDDAIAELDRALADSPQETTLILEAIRLRLIRMASQTSLDSRRSREVAELLDRGEKISPQNSTLLSYRAEYYAMSGQLPKAIEQLSKAVEGDGRKSPEIWIGLAQGLDRLGRRAEAVQVLDRACLSSNVGDTASLRIAKSKSLVRAGKGREAREALSHDIDHLNDKNRTELAQARGDLLRELGDRDGARAAFAEWSKLSPGTPGPALALLAMGQLDNDEKASELGLQALKEIGGDREPYGMAAKALELLRTPPNQKGTLPANRLYEADSLVKVLRHEVPSLRIGSLLEGMIFEARGDLASAVKSYKAAQKDDINSPALTKLIEAYIKLKRFDELDGLRREFESEAQSRQQPSLTAEFDRISSAVALRLGDKDRADFFASRMIEAGRDNVAARTTYARLLDANNKTEEAEESLKALVKDKPDDPKAWLTLIAFQALRRTSADVARTIGQVRREYKPEKPELFLAQCYWLGKDLPNAKAAFKKAAEARPDDLVTLRSQAEFYDDSKQIDLLEAVLRKVLSIDPTTTWASRQLAMLLSRRSGTSMWREAWSLVEPGSPGAGETPEDRLIRATILARSVDNTRRGQAVQEFANLANDLPVSSLVAIDTRLRLGQAMIDSGRFVDAWDAVRPLAEDLARPNAAAMSIAIEALARDNRPDEAERLLERLKALSPGTPQVMMLTAWIANARGKKTDAIAALDAAFNSLADGSNAENDALIVLDRMMKFGDLDASLRFAESLSRRWPADASCIALVRFARKEYDQVLAATEASLETSNPRDSIRYVLGSALARKDDKAFALKATSLAELSRKKAPKDGNVLILLATLYHLQDRYDEEVACYTEALDLKPESSQFLNNMAWTLCEGLGRPDEAMKHIQTAILTEGESAQYLDTKGVIEERVGQYPKAIADLESSVKLEPSAATYFHLARAYLKAKDPASARRCRELALKTGFNFNTLDPTDKRELSEVMGTP